LRYDGTDWVQRGTDILGEAAGDSSGFSVSLSDNGNILAIGAPHNDGDSTNTGHVRVWSFSDPNWVQLGTDIDGETAGDRLGHSVSLSGNGNILAIGTESNDGRGSSSGYVRVLEYNTSHWVQLGTDIDGGAAGDYSGFSVALSNDGNTLAIGPPSSGGDESKSEYIRVLRYDGTDWVQLGTDIDGEGSGEYFGYTVSLSNDGNTLVIGAPGNGANGFRSGHVRVLKYNTSDWVQVGTDIDGEEGWDYSGYAVALSADGESLAVGARYNDATGSDSGYARVFNALLTTQVPSAAPSEVPSASPSYDEMSFYIDFEGDKMTSGFKETNPSMYELLIYYNTSNRDSKTELYKVDCTTQFTSDDGVQIGNITSTSPIYEYIETEVVIDVDSTKLDSDTDHIMLCVRHGLYLDDTLSTEFRYHEALVNFRFDMFSDIDLVVKGKRDKASEQEKEIRFDEFIRAYRCTKDRVEDTVLNPITIDEHIIICVTTTEPSTVAVRQIAALTLSQGTKQFFAVEDRVVTYPSLVLSDAENCVRVNGNFVCRIIMQPLGMFFEDDDPDALEVEGRVDLDIVGRRNLVSIPIHTNDRNLEDERSSAGFHLNLGLVHSVKAASSKRDSMYGLFVLFGAILTFV